MDLLHTVIFIIIRNSGLIGMTIVYAVLLLSPSFIGNLHAKAILSQFIVYMLPGFITYKLTFNKSDHDLYEKLTLSFTLSCFVFIMLGSFAYYFRISLVLYMRFLLFLFIVGSLVLLYRDSKITDKSFELNKTFILDFFILLITGALVYFYTCSKSQYLRFDYLQHLANTVKISDSGIITPMNPWFEDGGLIITYLYSPYFLIMGTIKKLSSTGSLVIWHYSPQIILFMLPICYYSVAKAAFKDKLIAYFAYFFVFGLFLSDYYWHSIKFPLPRRISNELLSPIFFMALIQYIKDLKGSSLILLVISTVVVVMFHPSGIPYIFFNGILCMLLLLVFKNGFKSFKERSYAIIAIFLANLPIIIGRIIVTPFKTTIYRLENRYATLADVYSVKSIWGLTRMKSMPFFTSDMLFCYLVIILLIFTQSNSALLLAMLATVLVVPVFLLFPPFADFFSKLFSINIMYRMHIVKIRPLFFICFLLLLSFYGIKYLQKVCEDKKNSKTFFRIGLVLIIAINTFVIQQYFWVTPDWRYSDIYVTMLLPITLKIVLIILTIISVPLFYYFNRKKNFLSPFRIDSNFHFSLVLFAPLILNTIFLLPKIKTNLSIKPVIPLNYIRQRKFEWNEDYVPKHLEYISSHEKPYSVVVLAKDPIESREIPTFIAQYTFNTVPDSSPMLSLEDIQSRPKITNTIYEDKLSLDKTLKILYEKKINYIIDRAVNVHGIIHKNDFQNNYLYEQLLKAKIIIRDKNYPDNLYFNDGRIPRKFFPDRDIIQWLLDAGFLLIPNAYNPKYLYFHQRIKNKEHLGEIFNELKIRNEKISVWEAIFYKLWDETRNVIWTESQLKERLKETGIIDMNPVLNIWRRPQHKKFSENNKFFKLVFSDNKGVFLYKVLLKTKSLTQGHREKK